MANGSNHGECTLKQNISEVHTKTAQVVLMTSCDRLVINKPVPGCARIASHCLLTISLLQVVNRLVSSCLPKLVIHRLAASYFNKL